MAMTMRRMATTNATIMLMATVVVGRKRCRALLIISGATKKSTDCHSTANPGSTARARGHGWRGGARALGPSSSARPPRRGNGRRWLSGIGLLGRRPAVVVVVVLLLLLLRIFRLPHPPPPPSASSSSYFLLDGSIVCSKREGSKKNQFDSKVFSGGGDDDAAAADNDDDYDTDSGGAHPSETK